MDKLSVALPDVVPTTETNAMIIKFATMGGATPLLSLTDGCRPELERSEQNIQTLNDTINTLDARVNAMQTDMNRERGGNINILARGVLRPSLRAKLIAENPAILLGEPVRLSFVVQNSTATDFQTMVGGDSGNSLGSVSNTRSRWFSPLFILIHS